MSKGLSLLEILIVCAIIVILGAISYPSARRLMPSIELNGTSRQIISDARQMQELAVTEQNRHLIRFSALPAQYQKIRVNDDSSETALATIQLDDLTLSINGLVNDEISYGSDGSPSSTGSITLTNTQNKQTTISVGTSGVLKEAK